MECHGEGFLVKALRCSFSIGWERKLPIVNSYGSPELVDRMLYWFKEVKPLQL